MYPSLNVKLFCDSADIQDMREMRDSGRVVGFTCNPSLCRKAGVKDYLAFAREAAEEFATMPLSLEVVADNPTEIRRQAHRLGDLGDNLFVKIPMLDTRGQSNLTLISSLADDGLPLNITAMFTAGHIYQTMSVFRNMPDRKNFLSIFAGRIADAGQDPCATVRLAVAATQGTATEVIWASVREPLNILQANDCGCHVVTVFPEVLRRLDRFGRDLDEFARETSEMFYRDAVAAGYRL